MILKLLTDKSEIAHCEKKFQEIIQDNCTRVVQGKFSYRSVSRNQKNFDLFFFEKQKFWVSFPIHSEEDKGYCNYFGVEIPIVDRQNEIIKELNVPKESINRSLSGAFAQDVDGREYLVDRGRVGGGAKGVSKRSFFYHYRGKQTSLNEINHISEIALVGCLDSNDFIEDLESHLHEIKRVKVVMKKPRVEIKESFQAIYTKESIGERAYKGGGIRQV